MKKILLYSGGLDSYIISKLWKPDIKLYVDMNTKYSAEEIKRLPKSVKIINLDLGHLEREDAIIPLRNMFLYMMASIIDIEDEEIEIMLGATEGDRIADKQVEFIKLLEPVLNYLWDSQEGTANSNQKKKKITLKMDYKRFSKLELIQLFIKTADFQDYLKMFWENNMSTALKDLIIEATYTCYSPKNVDHMTDVFEEPCWSCKACFRNFCALYQAGYKPTPEELKSLSIYVKENVIKNPSIILNRGKETDYELKTLRELFGLELNASGEQFVFCSDFKRPPIIAIDYDNTIVKGNFTVDARISTEVIVTIKTLKEAGYILILWTCREGELLKEAIENLKKNNVEFDFVNENHPLLPFKTSNKIYADYYIDDRAQENGVIDWKKIPKIVKNLNLDSFKEVY